MQSENDMRLMSCGRKTGQNEVENQIKMGNEFKLYQVTADYRPKNVSKPRYYVCALNKNHAKKKFAEYIDWLKIYDIQEVTNAELAEYIKTHPYDYICFNKKCEE